ncbi:MAG: hypothetical protein D6705_16690 [Deltaproteobacteria bacterium]|nr:MAG: hypothetical protein D6705_16690 [Deltaproteobacteria bacterium]
MEANVADAQRTQCTGCGAPIIVPADRLSAQCEHCDSPVVDEARGRALTDGVVPFQLPRRAAAEAIAAHLRSKWLAPRALARMRVLERHLEGHLVPLLAFDGAVTSKYAARIGINYTRTETYRGADGKPKTRTVIETEWFSLRGECGRNVEDHLVSAAPVLDEATSNDLEPFDLGWAQPFDARLVAGFSAHVPVAEPEAAARVAVDEIVAQEQVRIEHAFLPGDHKDLERLDARFDVDAVRTVLLPVWIAQLTFAGKPLTLYVNGQTGKVVGKVPISPWKVTGLVVLAVALVAAVFLLVRGCA